MECIVVEENGQFVCTECGFTCKKKFRKHCKPKPPAGLLISGEDGDATDVNYVPCKCFGIDGLGWKVGCVKNEEDGCVCEYVVIDKIRFYIAKTEQPGPDGDFTVGPCAGLLTFYTSDNLPVFSINVDLECPSWPMNIGPSSMTGTCGNGAGLCAGTLSLQLQPTGFGE